MKSAFKELIIMKEDYLKEHYFKSVNMIERLHRLFLEGVKVELSRMNIRDINNIQCLLLYNIGQERVIIGELTNRGYYLGSNVSYNLSKMVEHGYLIQEPNLQDRRSSFTKLSEKGVKLYDKLDEWFNLHAKALMHEGIEPAQLGKLENMLTRLEGFWTSLLTHKIREEKSLNQEGQRA
jgi:DNA-binding MarR family transcriptional regulator